MDTALTLVDKLAENGSLSFREWVTLIDAQSEKLSLYVFEKARDLQQAYYDNKIFIRGLIEFTNYCRNDCFYCGIRKSNQALRRYRLTKEESLLCCQNGYEHGFRTFVLQGGEDAYYTDARMIDIITKIKSDFPDCAITLSIGEKSRESYQKFFDAGVSRYLLRHETFDSGHYQLLHPSNLKSQTRQQCLRDLRAIGYQTGCGFMVGSPYQTTEHLASDFLFIKELNPHMIGLGPFIPHHDTPFAEKNAGTLAQTLYLLGLLRIMCPKVLLPATTALGTIAENGRELGILAGANVIMPNLSPINHRKDYALYDNKLTSGAEAAEHIKDLKTRMQHIGYEIVTDRGDSLV